MAAKFDPAFPWVVQKEGIGGSCSAVPYCGYSLATLKNMAGAGYILYYEGKRVKLSGLTDAQVKKAGAM